MTELCSIPDDRPMTLQESALLQWLLEHGRLGAEKYLRQHSDARVVARCGCGCASIDLAVDGLISPDDSGMHVLAEYEYRTSDDHLCGVFVFARGGILSGLEVWSIDGLCTPSALPTIEQLRPSGSSETR